MLSFLKLVLKTIKSKDTMYMFSNGYKQFISLTFYEFVKNNIGFRRWTKACPGYILFNSFILASGFFLKFNKLGPRNGLSV